MEKIYISNLDGKFIRIKQNIYAYVFSLSMDKGSQTVASKGDEFLLSGNVYVYDNEYRFFELKSSVDSIICLAAEDVDYILMDDKEGGSLGSFLGFLKLPFALPFSDKFMNKFNGLLKKLAWAAGILGTVLIAKNLISNEE